MVDKKKKASVKAEEICCSSNSIELSVKRAKRDSNAGDPSKSKQEEDEIDSTVSKKGKYNGELYTTMSYIDKMRDIQHNVWSLNPYAHVSCLSPDDTALNALLNCESPPTSRELVAAVLMMQAALSGSPPLAYLGQLLLPNSNCDFNIDDCMDGKYTPVCGFLFYGFVAQAYLQIRRNERQLVAPNLSECDYFLQVIHPEFHSTAALWLEAIIYAVGYEPVEHADLSEPGWLSLHYGPLNGIPFPRASAAAYWHQYALDSLRAAQDAALDNMNSVWFPHPRQIAVNSRTIMTQLGMM